MEGADGGDGGRLWRRRLRIAMGGFLREMRLLFRSDEDRFEMNATLFQVR